jgi:diguanylate cyclase (GGDEF)-like protein
MLSTPICRDARWPLVALLVIVCVGFALHFGTPKPTAVVDYLDVLGEGSTLLLALIGVGALLLTRPRGKVTTLLFVGSLLLCGSLTLDLLDEFFRYPEDVRYMSWLESLPLPLGLLVLAAGMYGWHHEQKLIERQLRARELHYRDHRFVDPLTTLYNRNYLEHILQREIALRFEHRDELCLLHLNVKGFARLNRVYGSHTGDRMLQRLGELLVSLLRDTDLVCRDHSDRFLLLLPHTERNEALALVGYLQQALLQELPYTELVRFDFRCHQVAEDNALAALQQLMLERNKVTAHAIMATC